MKRFITASTFLLAAYAAIMATPGVVAQGRQLLFPPGTLETPGLAVEGAPRTGLFYNDQSDLVLVRNGKIIQTFGSGGAFPSITDDGTLVTVAAPTIDLLAGNTLNLSGNSFLNLVTLGYFDITSTESVGITSLDASVTITSGSDTVIIDGGADVRAVIGSAGVFRVSDGSAPNLEFRAAEGMGMDYGADLAVVGASQNLLLTTNYHEVSAASAADVTTITLPTGVSGKQVTLVCSDTNLTFTDTGPAGANDTLDIAGDLVCTENDLLVLQFILAPITGNRQWLEVSRSVN